MTTFLPRFPAASRAATLAASLALACAAHAIDDRDAILPVQKQFSANNTQSGVESLIANGWRVTDIEITVSAVRFYSIAAVKNTGAYQMSTTIHWELTEAQLATLAQSGVRILDLEPFLISGQLRFLAISTPNSGGSAKSWWLKTGATSFAELDALRATHGARFVDLETYSVGAMTYWAGVMLLNAGADAKTTSVLLGATPQLIQAEMAAGKRLYDIESDGSGGFHCVFAQDGARTWFYPQLATSNEVSSQATQLFARAMDVETWKSGSTTYYAAVFILNGTEPLRLPFGSACPSSAGTPAMTADLPVYGRQIAHVVTGCRPAGAVAMAFGASSTQWGAIPLPLDLGPLGAPGCKLLVEPVLLFGALTDAQGAGTVRIFIPSNLGLLGAPYFAQFLHLDPGKNAMGVVTSNALGMLVGGTL